MILIFLESNKDCNSLQRLYNYATENELRLKNDVILKCRRIFTFCDKLSDCPFVLSNKETLV